MPITNDPIIKENIINPINGELETIDSVSHSSGNSSTSTAQNHSPHAQDTVSSADPLSKMFTIGTPTHVPGVTTDPKSNLSSEEQASFQESSSFQRGCCPMAAMQGQLAMAG
jgi:hypothetical protein